LASCFRGGALDKNSIFSRLESLKNSIEKNQSFVLDDFKEDDALGATLSYYIVYGNSFPYDGVYSVERTIEEVRNKTKYAVVARTPKGDIVGISAIYTCAPNPKIYELGGLVVIPDYRNKDLAKQLMRYTLEVLAKRNKVEVLFGEAVTHHTITQKMIDGYGYRASGAEFNSLLVKASKDSNELCKTTVFLVFIINKDIEHSVFLPSIYKSFIEYVINVHNLTRAIAWIDEATAETPSDSAKTDCSQFYYEPSKTLKITINSIGLDLVKEIEKISSSFGLLNSIQIILKSFSKYTPWAVFELRKNKFSLGGMLPLWFSEGDGFFMQKASAQPEFDKMQLFSEVAKKVIEYTKEDWNKIGECPIHRPEVV